MEIIWNTKDFFKKMGHVETKATNAAKMAVEAVAEDVLTKSQNEVPLDQGDLMRSGQVEHKPDFSIVSYGGMAVDYAIFQHEGMRKDGSHVVRNYTFSGRKSKYLEDPIKNNLSFYQKKFGQIFAGSIGI
jgi:hypothetical protein